MTPKLTRRDWLTALGIILVIGLLSVMTLRSGHHWGDDYAAYLNEAFAISQGRLAQQDQLNVLMHPSPLTFLDEQSDSLSYVWGYPLILSILHRLIGFDTWNYSSLIYYKLPGAAFIAILGGVLFLFYRRRFSYITAVFLSVLFCLSSRLWPDVNVISPELLFLLLKVLCFWIVELVLDERCLILRIIKLVLLGFLLWAAYVVRLNGFSVFVIVALAHAVRLLHERKWRLVLLWDTLPYLICFLLLCVSYHFFPIPTSNLSDIGNVTVVRLFENCRYYFRLLCDWFVSLFSRTEHGLLHYDGIGPILLILSVLGISKNGLKDLHLIALILCTLLTVCSLNYQQGLRYLYGILPYLLMFAAHGVKVLADHLMPHFDDAFAHISRLSARFGAMLIIVVVLIQNGTYAFECFNTRGDALPDHDAYSTFAVDVYRFIQKETPEDCSIAFYKPRGLYLNTGRTAFKPQVDPKLVHNEDALLPYQPRYIPLESADYLLLYDDINDEEYKRISIELEGKAELELIYENKLFELYQLI